VLIKTGRINLIIIDIDYRMKRDDIFLSKDPNMGDFVFDETVASVFDDMIFRSVPGYASIVAMIGLLAGKYIQDNTNCYDLGASTGIASKAVLENLKAKNSSLIAVDSSKAMTELCKAKLSVFSDKNVINIVTDDICNIHIGNASMVILNLTLQFISPDSRLKLLKKIYKGMKPGGILLLSEKVKFKDKNEDMLQTELYHVFKELNGYSKLEISRKRTALENVLVSDTIDTHIKRLKRSGFKKTYKWFQCFNFVSLLAMK